MCSNIRAFPPSPAALLGAMTGPRARAEATAAADAQQQTDSSRRTAADGQQQTDSSRRTAADGQQQTDSSRRTAAAPAKQKPQPRQNPQQLHRQQNQRRQKRSSNRSKFSRCAPWLLLQILGSPLWRRRLGDQARRGARMDARAFLPVHGCTVKNPSRPPRTRGFIASATSGSPFFWLLFFGDSKKSDSATAEVDETLRRAKPKREKGIGMFRLSPKQRTRCDARTKSKRNRYPPTLLIACNNRAVTSGCRGAHGGMTSVVYSSYFAFASWPSGRCSARNDSMGNLAAS